MKEVECQNCGVINRIPDDGNNYDCISCGDYVLKDNIPKTIKKIPKKKRDIKIFDENKKEDFYSEMIVECPYCGANNEINDNTAEFVCHSCEKPFKKKNNLLIVTCPKCGSENRIINRLIYVQHKGAVCYYCGNFIPRNKKFEHMEENWEKKVTATDVAKGTAKVASWGIGTILIVIFAVFAFFCMVLLF